MLLLYSLRLAWWNVNLTPPSQEHDSGKVEKISIYLHNLLTSQRCDMVALCELCSDDAELIKTLFPSFKVLNLTTKLEGQSRFNMAVIFNPGKINIQHVEPVIKKTRAKTITKAAQHIVLTDLSEGKEIHIFLCHWASRLRGGEDKRIRAAKTLRVVVEDHINDNKSIIVMGDFNDNPYNQSLLKEMQATRCHDTIRKYPYDYLFNPFWRSIVSEQYHFHGAKFESYLSGSYRYDEKEEGTLYSSYDQMLFSGSFISDGDYWCLNEYETKIMKVDDITDAFLGNHFIDHLPVVCELTRSAEV